MKDNITTSELDILAAEISVNLGLEHIHYTTLASRIAIDNHQKNTNSDFWLVMNQLHENCDIHNEPSPLISDELHHIIQQNKDKLNKRLFAIKVLKGELNSEEITLENKNIGKLLINSENPFALLKLENKKFNFDLDLKCGDANIKVIKPSWI